MPQSQCTDFFLRRTTRGRHDQAIPSQRVLAQPMSSSHPTAIEEPAYPQIHEGVTLDDL